MAETEKAGGRRVRPKRRQLTWANSMTFWKRISASRTTDRPS